MVVLTQCRLIERTLGIQYPGKFRVSRSLRRAIGIMSIRKMAGIDKIGLWRAAGPPEASSLLLTPVSLRSWPGQCGRESAIPMTWDMVPSPESPIPLN